MTTEALEQRVAALEQMALNYSTMKGDEDRLVSGVERLADETGGLNSILNKVDEQQQRLSRLGRDLERVERTSASKEDLEKSAKAALKREAEERRKRSQKVTTWIVFGLAGLSLVALSYLTSEADRRAAEERYRQGVAEVCEARNKQGKIIAQLITASNEDVDSDPTLTPQQKTDRKARGQALADAFPIVNCGALR